MNTGMRLKLTVARAMINKGTPLSLVARMLKHVRFPAKPALLGSSIKVEKGEEKGVLTAVLYLSPASESRPYGGANVCPHATPGCIEACLGHSSGRLALDTSKNARVWKTLTFLYCRELFLTMLRREITAHAFKAHRKGLTPAVRLNGTSDIAWERFNVITKNPDVQFYDYTKNANRALAWARGELPSNYHVTYSWAETPENHVGGVDVANAGGNLAVVFRTRKVSDFPKRLLGLPVIDGDASDVRFGDPKGSVVGLTCKGNVAMKDTSGFVQEIK